MLAVIFHSLVFSIYVYSLWYDQMYVDLPLPEGLQNIPFKARAIFLTFWCLALQTVYFGIAILNDLTGTNDSSPKRIPAIRKIKDALFSLAFPVALYVGAVFWTLYNIDKNLIFPENMEKVFPLWLNHVMHTMIMPSITLELIFLRRNYPRKYFGLSIAITFILAYISWINYLYFTQKVWVYPFLEVLNWPVRIMFFTCSLILGVLVYTLGEKFNTLITPNSKTYVNGVSKKD